MEHEEENPPLPCYPPPDSAVPEIRSPVSDPAPRTVTFTLSTDSSQPLLYGGLFNSAEFSVLQEEKEQQREEIPGVLTSGSELLQNLESQDTIEVNKRDSLVVDPSFISSEFHWLSLSDSPGIKLLEKDFGSNSLSNIQETSCSWKANNLESDLPSPRASASKMIIEEVTTSSAATKTAVNSLHHRSVANSLDSLSECPNSDYGNNGHVCDRSQSLGDLLISATRAEKEARNGSFDTLMSKGLTDSGIDGGLVRDDNSSPDHTHTDLPISLIDFSYPPVSFSSYDSPGHFSNENTNPLDASSRCAVQHEEGRKQPELPAISEESEHEHTHSFSADREVIEHAYPMTHCNSAPSNAYASSYQQSNNNFAHRRVVSDDVTETTRLKRSDEMEHVDIIGKLGLNQKLKKGRCKSLMLVLQGDEENSSSEEEAEEENRNFKDNDMLILGRSNDTGYKNNINYGQNYDKNVIVSSNAEPPPVRLARKVSATSTRSTPVKSASDQSWKEKMPPFAFSGHTMFSPQSLPSRDAMPRSPFDGAGTISGGGSNRLVTNSPPSFSSVTSIDSEATSPDGGPCIRVTRRYTMSPPTVLIAEQSDELPPLSSIFGRTTSVSSTATEITNISPSESSPKSQNNSFVRRSLRKIMKRGTVSSSSLGEQYDGPRTSSLKRRASAASTSLIASAQAHLRPRTKSLKKQSWICSSSSFDVTDSADSYVPSVTRSPSLSSLIKANKKEKSGSDTFTFGNLFRKKQQPNRANLADIITDLDTRSVEPSGNSKQGVGFHSANRRSTSASIIPMSENGTIENASLEGLPDHISRIVSSSDVSDVHSSSSLLYAQLDKHWGKYDLFSVEEYQSWHEKYKHNTLSSKQVKKQDAIFELYLMEKRHCANIAFLLQGYRRRMLDENVISKNDMDILIPDVLEPLLIFHLNVLERFKSRMNENHEVSTISDIICEELDVFNGTYTKLCCDAYTDFGAAKEKSDRVYNHLMSKNGKFADFIRRNYNGDPLYKEYEFRPLITKIIGRATKYSLLLETILKNEQQFSEQHDLTSKALETARQFAHKIDESLAMAHMSRTWEEVRSAIDPSSSTSLYVNDSVHSNSVIKHHLDLDALNSVPNRRLIYIGDATVKYAGGPGTSPSANSTKFDTVPSVLVLFDDILLFVCRNRSRYYFPPNNGAIPTKSMIIRPSARGHMIMVISGSRPALFEVNFHNTSDRKKWISFLESAHLNSPPEGVRLSQSNEEEMVRQRAAIQTEREDVWLQRLQSIFDARYPEEEALSSYLESRLKFFDEVRQHMAQMPFKSRHDISDRIREAVRARFRELRRSRVIPLNRLIDRMSESRDSDLWSFFDDKADAADVPDKSSDLSDDSSSSEESVSGSSRAKPRRIQTFHGTSQPGGSSSNFDSKNGIRRHTTVPRMNSDSGSITTDRAQVDEVEEEEQCSSKPRGESVADRKQYEEMMAKLPLRQSLKARRASTKLIKEVIALRKENHLLRNDNALTKSRCALLERSRGGSALSSTASTVDGSMEMLRRKEKEIREQQKQMQQEQLDLIEKQKAIEAQEKEIQSKWAALQLRSVTESNTPMHVRSSSSHSVASSPGYRTAVQAYRNTELSPALASLATKTETKKAKK